MRGGGLPHRTETRPVAVGLEPTFRRPQGGRHGIPHPRQHRSQCEHALPRRDDVRRVGQHRCGRLRADHPRRARRWHQLRRHRRRLLGRGVRGDRRTRAQGPPRRRRARHEGARRDGGGRQPAGQLPGVDHARGGGQPAPARHRPHRPVSDPPAGAADRYRGDAERAHRSAAPGEDPVLRFVHLPGLADGRGAVDGGASRPGPVPHRAAAVLDLRPSDRAGRPAGRAALRHGRAGVEPALPRMAHRPVPARRVRRLAAVPRRHARRSGASRPSSTGRVRRSSGSSTWSSRSRRSRPTPASP